MAKTRWVAHNPESNMKLVSGVAPVPQLLKKRVLGGLGTDSASVIILNMLEEMRTVLYCIRCSRESLRSCRLIKFTDGTKDGAKVLGWNMWSLKPVRGRSADF